MKNDWLMSEIALLREHYATAASCAELMAMFPRHTPGSVRRTARAEGLSRPRAGVVKFRPGLARMIKLIEANGSLTSREIGSRLGIKQRAVENLRHSYSDAFRVAGWVPPENGGKWSPKLGIANGMPDAPKPFVPKGAKIGRMMSNPFALLAGTVPIVQTVKGRVFKHLTDDEMEAAA